jgi:hypothetical protein
MLFNISETFKILLRHAISRLQIVSAELRDAYKGWVSGHD